MVRTVAIWVFGLLAAAIIGGVAGSAYDFTPNPYNDRLGQLLGAVAGMCVFACVNLWLGARPK